MICTACRGLKVENTSEPGVFRPCHWCNGSGLEWNPTNAFMAQSAHVGWSAFLSLSLCLLGPWWSSLAVLVPLAAIKEFVADIWWLDETTTYAAEAVDFGFECLGIALGAIAWYVLGAK